MRGGIEMNNMTGPKVSREERRYSVPHGPNTPMPPPASEDLHAWSIYRQNLNSDFTDSALGSSDKSPLPYGNFQLRDTTVQSILNHPRYGPKSPLGSNMYTYLKFGLPRVFPPNANGTIQAKSRGFSTNTQNRGRVNRGYRESQIGTAGSSGYDSSDNETTRSRLPPNLRKFRSESDFRQIIPNSRPSSRAHGNIPLAALRQANSRASIAGTQFHHNQMNGKHYGNRSHSEADLLGGGGPDPYEYDSSRIYAPSRARSDQHLISRRHSAIGLVYPNIQIHSLDISNSIRGVTIQAKAGDLFAVMATSHKEGTTLMETLAGLRDRVGGEILVNGQHITQQGLRDLCGYVPSPENAALDPRMSVQSTLSFHASLRGPIDESDLQERIDILIEDLGLTAVRTSNVSRLTHSEKQRLSVACQLLTNASILVLDQATTNMDIFDTFFLVEYLRQWSSSGRIVIMTLQPPTFEILSMCSGVLLLSGGRTIFSGSRSDLPRHMGSLGYPCPPFKNPADYYLDLVTLDDLSAAAMLESSARIESLANSWEQINANEIPIGAPPATMPNYTRRAGFFKQLKTLGMRFIVYKQPNSLLNWISKLICAAVLSLLVGCVFWDVPASDPQLTLNDRLGYHHCILAVAFWPILLLTIRDINADRIFAEKEISLKLYSRTLYIIIQNMLSLLPSLCIWLAYLLPAYSMAGLYSYTPSSITDDRIYIYMGFMLIYLTAIQTIALFFTHFFASPITATVWSSLLHLALTSAGGYSVHVRNLPSHWQWLEIISPERWLLPVLVADEYSPETIANTAGLQLCRNKQVQHQEIIVQQQCPPPNGTAILADMVLLTENHVLDPTDNQGATLIALVITSVLFFILTFVVFAANTRKLFIKKRKSNQQ